MFLLNCLQCERLGSGCIKIIWANGNGVYFICKKQAFKEIKTKMVKKNYVLPLKEYQELKKAMNNIFPYKRVSHAWYLTCG